MARIAGINLPPRKHVYIALQYIYGIGATTAMKLCKQAKVDPSAKLQNVPEQSIELFRQLVTKLTVEGELRRQVSMNIKRLMDLGTYRGIRHRRRLPTRGQRTKTNARTRKGPRRLVKK